MNYKPETDMSVGIKQTKNKVNNDGSSKQKHRDGNEKVRCF